MIKKAKSHEISGPNFDRLLTALRCGVPDRVPLTELLVDHAFKEAFLGRPIQDVQDDIQFAADAGYN